MISSRALELIIGIDSGLFKAGFGANHHDSWVHNLPRSLAEEHFTIVQCTCDTFEHNLVQLCTDTYLLALKEILEGIKRMSPHNIGDYSTCPSEVALGHLLASHNNGLVYNWGPIAVLAQNDKHAVIL